MTCGQAREQLSARLDGEDDARLSEAVDAHVAGCAGCAAWLDQAGRVTRLARTAAALPGPVLSAEAMRAVLDAAPAAGPAPARAGGSRLAVVLWAALLGVGLGQFFLGVAQIANAAAATEAHHGTAPVSTGHLWHESAAWNVAIGVALAWLAWRRMRPAALLPVMTAFVVVLGLLTINDALTGRVEADRILSHGFVLGGYLLLLALHHPKLHGRQPPAARGGVWSSGSTGRGGDDTDGPIAQVYPFPVQLSEPATRRVDVQRKAA